MGSSIRSFYHADAGRSRRSLDRAGRLGDVARMEQPRQVEPDERFRWLQLQGEVLFEQVASQLDRLQPGRERTREEFEQVCVALALFVHHLLDGDGDEP